VSAAPARWRLIIGDGDVAPGALVPPPLPGIRNMAIDQALFESVQGGSPPALRLYRWRPACLSFGRNQRARGIYDPASARRDGIDVVRRPTGGLAVLHDGELTYAVLAPAALLGGARAGYVAINEALVAALRALGAPAALGAGTATHVPSPDALHPCFERPAPGEVVAAGRKLVGSAQRVEGRTILQHGSILCSGDQDAVLRLQYGAGGAAAAGRAGLPLAPARGAAGPQAGPAAPALRQRGEVTLAELLGTAPDWATLAGALRRAFDARFGIALAPAALFDAERARAAVLEEQFGSDDWTWRR
jgi:lipoate-protein ligase A